jgi:hypothetical protein
MSDTEGGNRPESHVQGASRRASIFDRWGTWIFAFGMVVLLAAVGVGGWLLGVNHGQEQTRLQNVAAAVTAAPRPTLPVVAATATSPPAVQQQPKAHASQALQSGCPSIAPIASGSTNVTLASGDFAGDGSANDVLKVYQLGSDWHVRVDIGGQGVDDDVLAGSGPMTAIGAATVNNDPMDEAWVKVSSGSATDVVGMLAFHNCNLQRVKLNNAPAAFAIGSTVTADDGLGCFGFNVGIEVFSTTSNDGVTYNGISKIYTLDLSSGTPKLVLGSTANQSETTSNGASYDALHTFHCDSLNTIP